MADMAGLLPTIKCSNCNAEVEISAMAEHICVQVPQASPASPPPELERQTSRIAQLPDTRVGDGNSSLKPPRPGPPPRIDPLAANRPFLRPDPLTPASSSSRYTAYSPGKSSPFRMPLRSQTSPLPSGPPSPELTNLDCAFPPFPISAKSKTLPEPKSTTSSASGKQNRGEFSANSRAVSPVAPSPAPLKPEMNFGHKREGSADTKGSFQTFSTNPGDPISRPSTANSSRRPSVSSVSRGLRTFYDDDAPPMPAGPPRGFTYESPSGSQNSTVAGGLSKRAESRERQREGVFGGPDSEITEEPQSYEDGGNSALGSSFPLHRTKTLPVTQDEKYSSGGPQIPLPRRPSGASDGFRTKQRMTSEKNIPPIPGNATYRPFASDDASQSILSPPPRNVNRVSSKENGDRDSNLSVSNFARALDLRSQYSNSGSATSSAGSSPSETRSQSSISSPPSVSSRSSRRKPSDLSKLDMVLKELQPFQEQKPETQKTSDDVRTTIINNNLPLAPPKMPEGFYVPDSPTDPAIYQGGLSLVSGKSYNDDPDPAGSRPVMRRSAAEPPTRRSTTPRRRCRACEQVITGKSVSSADGRLTGRYHKACFVCYTCRAPFQTADFYVLNDHPYCAQHYHELNGSLCAACNTGIEGQYLETNERAGRGASDRQKFHPDCLKCRTCRIVLKGDYFEWNGHVYCERDARRAAASTPPPGRRRPTMPSSPLAQSYGFPPGPPPRGSRLRPEQRDRLGAPGGARRFPERRTTRMMMI